MLPSGFLLEGGRRMITVFNRETIYIGNDMGRFSQIRDILSRAGIDYTYKVSNPLNRALGTSGGETVRSMTGGIGFGGAPAADIYEVFVRKKDYERAKYILDQRQDGR